MNILDVQDSLKDLSESQLIKEMQMPSGTAPQFLVLGEIQRRKRVRDDFASQQAKQQPTVAQEAVAAMGIPQAAGMDMQQALNPNRSMVQNAPSGGIANIAKEPPMQMKEGGVLGYMDGGVLKFDEGGTLGIRNMNPGNIRPGAQFFGETGSDKGYATFKSPAHGLRAMARLFQTYKDEYDIDTIDEFVDRYAPANDNDEKSRQNYKQFLADALGVGVNDEVDLVARSDDLIPAVTKFENAGNMPYSDDMVDAAIKSSSVEDEAEVDSMLGGFQTSSAADFSTSQAAQTEPSLLNKLGIVNPAAAATLSNPSAPTSDDQMKLDMIETFRTSDDPKGMDAEGTLKEIIRDTQNNSSAVRVAAQMALNEIVSPKKATPPPVAQTDSLQSPDDMMLDGPQGTSTSTMDNILNTLFPRRNEDGLFGIDLSKPIPKEQRLGATGFDNPNNPLSSGLPEVAATPVGASTTTQGNVAGLQTIPPEDPSMLDNFFGLFQGSSGKGRGRGSTTTSTTTSPGTDDYNIGDAGEFDTTPPTVTSPMMGLGSMRGAFSDMGTQTVQSEDGDQDPKIGSPNTQGDATTSTSSDLMSEIDELRAKLDKDRDSDKWLALAQAGMALMSSTNPTMMGALGEAGTAGLKALRGSEADYDKGVASLLSAKAKLTPKPTSTSLTQAQALTQINQITELLNKTVETIDPADPTGMTKIRVPVVKDEKERLRLQNLLSDLYLRSGMQNIGDLKTSQAS